MASDFTVRRVCWSEDEAPLRAVRQAVFVAEQGVPLALEWDGEDPDCLHLLALSASGEPVGTARMTREGHIGRMAVLALWRKRGVGSALLQDLLDAARRQGLAEVYLNAQVRAAGFYLHHGFEPVGEVFLDADIPHRRMVKHLGIAAQSPVL